MPEITDTSARQCVSFIQAVKDALFIANDDMLSRQLVEIASATEPTISNVEHTVFHNLLSVMPDAQRLPPQANIDSTIHAHAEDKIHGPKNKNPCLACKKDRKRVCNRQFTLDQAIAY